MTNRSGILLLLSAAFLTASCQPPAGAAGASRQALPAKAKVAFDLLRPVLKRPQNPPGAEAIPPALAGDLRKADDLISEKKEREALALLDRVRQPLAKAGKTTPDNLQVQKGLANHAYLQGRLAEAVRRYRLALLCSDAREESPDTGEAMARLAVLLEQQGYLTAAAACYERLGELAVAHGRTYAGRPMLQRLIDEPERCVLAAGRVLLKAGDHRRAAELLERAYRYDKTHRRSGLLAVEALIAVKDLERAEDIVMEMAQEKALPAASASAALMLCRVRKDPAVPLRMLRKFLKARGTNSTFVVTLATLAADYGAAREAAGLLAQYRAGASDDRAVALRLARLHARTGRAPAAAAELARMLDDDAAGVGRVRAEMSELARAALTGESIRPIVGAADQAGDDLKPPLLCVAGLLAEQVDEPQRAERLYTKAIQAGEKFYPAYEALYDLHVRAGKAEAARSVLKQLDAAAGESHYRHYMTGREHLRKGRVPQAVEALEAARERRGRHVPTLMELGRAYVLQRQPRKAEQRLLAAYALAPSRLSAARELFNLYVAAGRRANAGSVVDRFVRDNPDNAAGRVLRARYFILSHQSDRAHEVLGELLAEDPDHVEAALLRVQLEVPELMSDLPVPADHAAGMIRRVRRILDRLPQNAPAERLYALLLVNQKRHADAARVLAGLHARKPRDVTLVNTYLASLAEAGKTVQARALVDALVARPALPGRMEEILIERLLAMEDHDKAVAVAETFAGRDGDASRTILRRLRLLHAYEKAKRHDRACQRLDDWLAKPGEEGFRPALRLSRIRFAAMAGKTDDAFDRARKWLAEPGADDARKQSLVQTLLAGESHEAALTLLEELLGAGGGDALMLRLRTWKMVCLAELERFDELKAMAARWIAQDPEPSKPPTPTEVAIGVLAEKKRFDDALAFASDLLERLGKSDPKAKDWAKQVHEARALVVSILLQAERKQKALRRARGFVQADPKDIRARTLLALVLGRVERDEEYLGELEQAYQLDKEEPGINNDLGY
ncbi:MAG: tetratricopeptide repeat protein, partial [Planctomycetota bacterium]